MTYNTAKENSGKSYKEYLKEENRKLPTPYQFHLRNYREREDKEKSSYLEFDRDVSGRIKPEKSSYIRDSWEFNGRINKK